MGVLYENRFQNLDDFNLTTTNGTITVSGSPIGVCTMTNTGGTGFDVLGLCHKVTRTLSEGDIFYWRMRLETVGGEGYTVLNDTNATFGIAQTFFGAWSNSTGIQAIDGGPGLAALIGLGVSYGTNQWWDHRLTVLAGGGANLAVRQTPNPNAVYDSLNTTYSHNTDSSAFTSWNGGGVWAFQAQNRTLNQVMKISEFYHTNDGVISPYLGTNHGRYGEENLSGTNQGFFIP